MSARELMLQALDALDIACRKYGDVGGAETDWGKWDAAMTALSARLAQPEQEPVAWHHPDCTGECIACLIERAVQSEYGTQGLSYLHRYVTAQQKREWVGLTDEEIWTSGSFIGLSDEGVRKFAREVEAKLKEKNG